MSAVPKPIASNYQPPSRSTHRRRSPSYGTPYQTSNLATRPVVAPPVVRSMPTPERYPLWLQLLAITHRVSSVVSFGMVVSVLAVYGWTVYSQQLWDREYRRLESLQRQERQLTAANELLKTQMAQEAEHPSSGLVSPSLDRAIFLRPAPQRPPRNPAATTPSPSVPLGPIGY